MKTALKLLSVFALVFVAAVSRAAVQDLEIATAVSMLEGPAVDVA
jgi:hypothetical protein